MFGWAKQEELNDLISRADYTRAIEILEVALQQNPNDGRLRRRHAEVLHFQGRTDEAVAAFMALADDLAREGRAAQSIAILKHIEAIQPLPPGEEEKVAELLSPEHPRSSVETVGVERPYSAPNSPIGSAHGASMYSATHDRAMDSVLFRDFQSEELVAVIHGMSLLTFEPGKIIVTEGEPGDGLFVICSGSLRAFARDREGRNVQLRELGEGDFFGEVSLLTASPRSATITATTDVELLVLDRITVETIAEAYPRIREVLEEFYRKRTGRTLESVIQGSKLKGRRKRTRKGGAARP